jgi:3-hydroxyisobutyrate dehydrogenase-like beta-hydroxyacid dehydrogenase
MAEAYQETESSIVFAGLGKLGYHLVRHLAPVAQRRAVPLYIHDRDRDRQAAVSKELALCGVDSFDEVPTGPSVVCVCVPDKDAVSDVIARAQERGLLANGVVLDFSSVPPRFARSTAERLARANVPYLDAPLTGGLLAAAVGEMVAMVGGDHTVMEAHRWIMESFCSRVVWAGASGNGALLKTVNNMVGNMAAIASMEGITMLRRAGLGDDAILEVLNNGPAATYFSRVRYPRFVVGGPKPSGAQLGLVNKDLDIALAAAKDLGCFPAVSILGSQLWHTALQKFGPDGDMLRMLDLVAELTTGQSWLSVIGDNPLSE